MAFVAFDKILNVGRQVAQLQITASAQLMGNVLGDVLGAAFDGVKRNDPDRLVLIGEQIGR